MPAASEHSVQIARIVPFLRLHHLGDRRFDYVVPEELAGRVVRGSLVVVPFGRRTVRGVVLGLASEDESARGPAGSEADAAELKPVEAVLPEIMPADLVDLACTLSDRYLCSLESCLRLVAPFGATSKRMRQAPMRKSYVFLVPDADPGIITRLTHKQMGVLDAIPAQGISRSLLCRAAGVGRGVLVTLERRGVIQLREIAPDERRIGESEGPTALGAGGPEPDALGSSPALWPEQQRAVEMLSAALAEPGLSERLLWGVTGSGKTEVYLRLIERALADGRGSILLVPEIALTPQTIRRVRARFGDSVGVFHSGLPRKTRMREYRRVLTGEARIVVGARSAIFAPVHDLGLVIIDESHDDSYKQEEEPRYRVKTVAQLRLAGGGGLLLEGSATPAVESMVPPEKRLRLSRRASGTPPEIEVVDMRRQGAGLLLASRSRQALAEVLRKGEQAIILLNRRGFAGYVHCDTCGHVVMCSDCELSLTYHHGERRLICHHCGRAYPQPAACPKCGDSPLTRGSPGTERLDHELRTLVPGEQVFRMDSDVAGRGAGTQAILEAFGRSHPGVLVGTQMVAKGHDFPDVTLVVVADADVGLFVPDFRAAEKTFQLLTQVAGRAGRADRPGRVLVQTSNPDVPCVRMALAGEEEAFYETELGIRERLGYPPFAELIRLVTSSADGQKAQAAARHLVERLSPYFAARELHGPAPLLRLKARSRWQVLVAAHQGERARTIIGRALEQLEDPYRRRGVVLLADVDPLSFS